MQHRVEYVCSQGTISSDIGLGLIKQLPLYPKHHAITPRIVITMSSSYYSIDSILTDAQKIPCKSHLHLPNLGHLDNNPGGDVRPPFSLPFHPPSSHPS